MNATGTALDPSGRTQQQLQLILTGTTPLMMHNVRLADQANEYAMELHRLHNEKKKKKGADKAMIANQMGEVEWEGGLYYGALGSPHDRDGAFIPGQNIFACIREAARMSRGGKTIERGMVIPHRIPLNYDGPKDLEGLRTDPKHRWRAIVTVQRARIPRVRPVFPPGWSIDLHLVFSPLILSGDDLLDYITQAGLFIGLGDGRSIGFGRFSVIAR